MKLHAQYTPEAFTLTRKNVFFLEGPDPAMIPCELPPYRMPSLSFKVKVWTLFMCYEMPV